MPDSRLPLHRHHPTPISFPQSFPYENDYIVLYYIILYYIILYYVRAFRYPSLPISRPTTFPSCPLRPSPPPTFRIQTRIIIKATANNLSSSVSFITHASYTDSDNHQGDSEAPAGNNLSSSASFITHVSYTGTDNPLAVEKSLLRSIV